MTNKVTALPRVPTDAELVGVVEAARHYKMSPAEEREQKVDWVWGQIFDASMGRPATLRQVRKILNV